MEKFANRQSRTTYEIASVSRLLPECRGTLYQNVRHKKLSPTFAYDLRKGSKTFEYAEVVNNQRKATGGSRKNGSPRTPFEN